VPSAPPNAADLCCCGSLSSVSTAQLTDPMHSTRAEGKQTALRSFGRPATWKRHRVHRPPLFAQRKQIHPPTAGLRAKQGAIAFAPNRRPSLSTIVNHLAFLAT
jgi:hypothetical protein